MPIAGNLDVLLYKAYENVSLSELVNAPLAALAGVNATDAEPPNGLTRFPVRPLGA